MKSWSVLLLTGLFLVLPGCKQYGRPALTDTACGASCGTAGTGDVDEAAAKPLSLQVLQPDANTDT